MKKVPVFGIALAVLAYIVMAVLASTSGLIHPVCYAYSGTVLPLFWGMSYLYSAANIRRFGAAALLNGASLIAALLIGENDPVLITGTIVLAVIAEIIRKLCGYDTIKGVRLSFIPLAFTFYSFVAHWWTDTEGSLEEAVEIMPSGYADKMEIVIGNVSLLAVMLVLVIPAAVIGMRIAEKVMKKQAAVLV